MIGYCNLNIPLTLKTLPMIPGQKDTGYFTLMKKFPFSRFLVVFLVLSIGIVSIACSNDDPDPIVSVDPDPDPEPDPDPVADPTNGNTTLEATSTVVANGIATAVVTVTLADTEGNLFTTSGGTVALTSTGDATVSAVTDNSDGTYTATVTNTTAEAVTISGTLGGTAIANTTEITFTVETTGNAAESTEPVGPTILRINSGGEEITISDVTFLEDQYGDGPSFSFVNEFLTDIENTEFDEVFITERVTNHGFPLEPFSYRIPVSNGVYSVKLYWAEVYWGVHPEGIDGGVGSRIFSVTMEGMPIISDIDLFADLGPATADTRMYDIEVTDGELTITFQSTVDRPKVSAIEIFGNSPINP